MYIRIFICIHINTCIHISIYLSYIYIYKYTYIHVHTRAHTHKHTHPILGRTHGRFNVCTHTHTHTQTDTDTDTNIGAYIDKPSSGVYTEDSNGKKGGDFRGGRRCAEFSASSGKNSHKSAR